MNKNVQNILSVLSKASAQEVTEGMNWYKDARAFCKKNAKEYNVSTEVVIACLSALSPRNKWKNNLRDCVTVLEAVRSGQNPEDVSVCTFNRNKEKAFAIVREGKPSLVQMSNKTASFFDNIKYASSEAVTVDMHAYSIYHGKVTPAKGLNDKEYAEVVEAYQEAAKIVGMKAYEVQAICWIQWRNSIKHGNSLELPFAA